MNGNEESEDWNVQTKKQRGGRKEVLGKVKPEKPQSPKTNKEMTLKTTTTAPIVEEVENKKTGPHLLFASFTLSCYSKEKGSENYEQSVKKIGTFSTVEDFWFFYSHLIRAHDVTVPTDFHLFVQGIKPTWEDEENLNGGKWMVRCKKGFSSRLWEDLLLGFIGFEFNSLNNEISGVVLSIRDHHDIISVWNKTATNQEVRYKIRDILIKILKLPPGTIMEYKTHNESLKDNSSFRNTETYKC